MKNKKYDYSNLKKLIKEKYAKQCVLARKLDITPQSINNKLNNISRFTYEEIEFLINDLEIEDKDIKKYFLQEEIL